MSLLDSMMEDFVIVDKATEPDGEGGFSAVWKDGATIRAAVVNDSSTVAQIAEKQGVTSTYTVTTGRDILLDFHTVLRRASDGAIFRTTSDPQDVKTPTTATLDMRQVKAEKWSLPS